MRKFLSLLIIALLTIGLTLSDANAKRFGGGRSFGMQRSMRSFSQPHTTPLTQPNTRSNRWAGPLTGLLAGGLLASLFMGHGLGNGLLAWLLVGGAVLLLMKLFMRKPLYASNNYATYEHQQHAYPLAARNSLATTPSPVGFNETAFLRDAKVQFLRLQAAYDSKDLHDIREFTSPEVFAEIQLQIQERGEHENHTVVEKLNVQLVEVMTEAHTTIASVHFTGSILEENISSTLNEVWHFSKNGPKWVVCGIQQM